MEEMTMMKLENLVYNRDLAYSLLQSWSYDLGPDLFKFCRISANAIYSFPCEGNTQYLRFAPVSEKDERNILAELEFINYLESRGFPSLSTVLSKRTRELEITETLWGTYFVSVFKQVPGVCIGDGGQTKDVFVEFGQTLGKLHLLSSQYQPNEKRWGYDDVLSWCEVVLREYSDQNAARGEADLLQTYFSGIEKTNKNFGLIHFDYEFDNVFYDNSTQSCHVIDFDDCMYHWFAMDIERTLNCLSEELRQDQQEMAISAFLMGYQEQFSISDETTSMLPACKRFADLYGYTRCLRSIQETPNEVADLRVKLLGKMKERSAAFCKKINEYTQPFSASVYDLH
jgi:Ser/Thr protein kinase RdoA (MazF antagonist)